MIISLMLSSEGVFAAAWQQLYPLPTTPTYAAYLETLHSTDRKQDHHHGTF
jgi:hypothetical protein